jgi:hypothetical protein
MMHYAYVLLSEADGRSSWNGANRLFAFRLPPSTRRLR